MATMTYTTKDGLVRQHELNRADTAKLLCKLRPLAGGQWFCDSDGWRINLAEVLTIRIEGEQASAEAAPPDGLAEFRRISEHLRDLACDFMPNAYDAQVACMDIDRLQALMESACLGADLPEGGE